MRWLSVRGRIGRGRFWLAHLLPVIAIALATALPSVLADRAAKGDVPPDPGLLPFLNLLLVWPLLAGMAKRLHDRGRTGAWLLAFAGLPTLPWFFLAAVFAGASAQGAWQIEALAFALVAGGLGLALAGLLLWLLVEILVLPGMPGPNLHGPGPYGPMPPPGPGLPPTAGPWPQAPAQGGPWGGPPPPGRPGP